MASGSLLWEQQSKVTTTEGDEPLGHIWATTSTSSLCKEREGYC